MGILRVYLALCVVATHAGSVIFPWGMHDGRQAVQVFYIISGFYMAMVLSSRYSKPCDFYVSRMMRIFPPYWITLVVTLLLCTTTGLFFHQWLLLKPYVHALTHNGVLGVVLSAAANLTLIGQDWIMFLSHDLGQPIHLTGNFRSDANPLWHYLIVPQCWSIGLELTFYSVAPYLNRLRTRWLGVLAFSALFARLFCYVHMEGAFDPWTYRFFPFELSLFLWGMLGYRLYLWTAPRHPSDNFRCKSGLGYFFGIILMVVLFYLQKGALDYFVRLIGYEFSILISYMLWALIVPVLFFVFGSQRCDRVIGELSYPIYLVHYVIIAVVGYLFYCLEITQGFGVYCAVASIVVSIVLYKFVVIPLDQKRHGLTRT